MALYVLEYDVRAKNHDYQPLYDELATFDAVRVLKSFWCFKRFNTTATGLRDHFKQFVHKDDGLAVFESSETNWSTINAEATPKNLK